MKSQSIKNNITVKSLLIFLSCISCTPTIALKAPEKPLEINLNVKIDHTIKVQVDKQLEDVMKNNDDIF